MGTTVLGHSSSEATYRLVRYQRMALHHLRMPRYTTDIGMDRQGDSQLMAELQGKRVDSVQSIIDGGSPGDYFPRTDDDGSIACLWFRLPTDTVGRIAAKGHGKDGEHEWSITEEDDGSITVDPSIEQHPTASANIPYWHGHLVRGVWNG